MRIAYVAAGAAGMYCGSCLRDNTVARAMLRLGEDVTLLPLYTPLRLERHDVQDPHVFYGGINIYLQQKFPIFRRFDLFDSFFNSKPLLRLTNRFAGSTDASQLGDLTLSTLKGDEGFQLKELEKLADWIANELKPDIINLPNSMFVGAARLLKERVGVPVVCSLTGEDLFLDGLTPAYRDDCMAELRSRASDVDGFIATSSYYADHMAQFMVVDRAKIDVVPLGIDLEGFDPPARRHRDPFTVGFLARMSPEKGFREICEAFAELKRLPGNETSRLHSAGYLAAKDRDYVKAETDRLAAAGLDRDFSYAGEVDFAEKLRFLSGISVLSVPTVHREPKGLFALEAMAMGVPVVLPEHGAFPEIIEATGGGLLTRPGDPAALAGKLDELRQDAEQADELGRRGLESVRERFKAEDMAKRTLEVYGRYV